MSLVRLEFPAHNHTLLEKVGQPAHGYRVQHVDFQVKPIADMEPVERNSFDQGDPRNISGLIALSIFPIADSQGMVNGKVELTNIFTNYELISGYPYTMS